MTNGRTHEELQGVTLLGNRTDYRFDYAPDVLEAFPNKHPERDYFVKFNCPESSVFATTAISMRTASISSSTTWWHS